MSRRFVVATRPGRLALRQTEIVLNLLNETNPELDFSIRQISSRGDRDRRTALWQLKSTGFFTSKLEDALLAGEADIAVHSYKDLPTEKREGLSIAAVCDRLFVEDCIVAAKPIRSIDDLPAGAKVGTSSLRRAVQIRRLRPDVECVAIRGNVTTRIRKLEQGGCDAVILARAGLERLGLGRKISVVFEPTDFLPAAAQGALAVQVRSNDKETVEVVCAIDDKAARVTADAERRVLECLNCGCHAPAGVYAELTGSDIALTAFLADARGDEFVRRQIAGPVQDAPALADRLAGEILHHM